MLVLLPAVARADTTSVQTTWRLLDYVAVDYGGAVHDGRVISQAEYAEMLAFTDSAAANIAALPPKGARAQSVADAKRLKAAVVAKESPRADARQARSVAAELRNDRTRAAQGKRVSHRLDRVGRRHLQTTQQNTK